MVVKVLGIFCVTAALSSGCTVESTRNGVWLKPASLIDSLSFQEIIADGPEQADLTVDAGAYEVEDQPVFCSDDIYGSWMRKQQRSYFSGDSTRKQRLASELQAWRVLNGGAIELDTEFGGMNPRVFFWYQHYQKNGRVSFLKWLYRGEFVRQEIEDTLRAHELPKDLFYVAMIESGFRNSALSRAKAAGTWQFMRRTGLRYGLRVNHWVDERRDHSKATVAASMFFRDLYAKFGDWQLSLAGYNAGPARVRSAMRRSGAKDYWELTDRRFLARETRQYVPKIVAATVLGRDMQRHGFQLHGSGDSREPVIEVLVPRSILLEELATLGQIERKALRRLNPEILRGMTPPLHKNGNLAYELRLPYRVASIFPSLLDQLSQLDVKEVHHHRIASGESLYMISKRYGVTLESLRKFNPGVRAKSLRPGKTIAIPIPSVINLSENDKSSA